MTEQNEFKALGMNMTAMTLIYGLFLIAWGATFYFMSGRITAGIPGFIGVPVLIAGVLALKIPGNRKIWMHIAVVFGLLNFLAGTAMIISAMGKEGGLFANSRKAASFIMMASTGLIFTISCVRSFIWARKNPPAEF